MGLLASMHYGFLHSSVDSPTGNNAPVFRSVEKKKRYMASNAAFISVCVQEA